MNKKQHEIQENMKKWEVKKYFHKKNSRQVCKNFSSIPESVNRFIWTSVEAIRAFDWYKFALRKQKESQLEAKRKIQ